MSKICLEPTAKEVSRTSDTIQLMESMAAQDTARQMDRVAAAGWPGNDLARERMTLELFQQMHGEVLPTSPGSSKFVARDGAFFQVDGTGFMGNSYYPPPKYEIERLMNVGAYWRQKSKIADAELSRLRGNTYGMPLDDATMHVSQWPRHCGPCPPTVDGRGYRIAVKTAMQFLELAYRMSRAKYHAVLARIKEISPDFLLEGPWSP